MSPGERDRHRFLSAMQAVLPGAQLARRRTWTVTKFKQFDGYVRLDLRSGRRTKTIAVQLDHYGPCLSDAGLRSVALPPSQRTLL